MTDQERAAVLEAERLTGMPRWNAGPRGERAELLYRALMAAKRAGTAP